MTLSDRPVDQKRGPGFGITALVVAGILVVPLFLDGGVSLLGALQSAACPPGTFLGGMLHFEFTEFLIVLIAVDVLCLAGLIGLRPRGTRTHPFVLPLATALPPMALLAVMTAFSQFCLTPDAVFYRPWPWRAPARYAWHDIARIETSCYYRRYADWRVGYVLTMKDGTGIDIIGGGDVAQAYPKLVHALSGVPFAFDASRARRYCNPAIPLTTPP